MSAPGGDGERVRLLILAAGGRTDRASAAGALARRMEDAAGGMEVAALSCTRKAGADPFRIRERVADMDASAAIVVAPRRWGARRLMPGAAVAGRTLALVQADRPEDLPALEQAARRADEAGGGPWVVAAMAKDVFLDPAGRWFAALRSGGRRVIDLRADRARRNDLLDAIAAGPGVVLYAGHGRTRGWGGYQGLRPTHLDEPRPAPRLRAGLVVALACDTLKRMRSGEPFGSQMVSTGIAGAYLGAAGPIRTADAERLGDRMVSVLSSAAAATVADLVCAVDQEVATDPAAACAWKQFRLLGDPLSPIRS